MNTMKDCVDQHLLGDTFGKHPWLMCKAVLEAGERSEICPLMQETKTFFIFLIKFWKTDVVETKTVKELLNKHAIYYTGHRSLSLDFYMAVISAQLINPVIDYLSIK